MMTKPHQYTNEQQDFLKANCELPRQKLTELFNDLFGTELSKGAISGYCKRHGWLTGRDGRIQKGQLPWNNGLKGKGVCKPNSGSFQKGQKPKNLKPLGHERICSKDGFILVKVEEENPYTGAKTRYRFKHHVVWESVNGPVPDGHVIRFRDGDKLNCSIDNLLCVSHALNLRMNQNQVNSLPAELKDTGHAIAKLEVATFDAMRRIHG